MRTARPRRRSLLLGLAAVAAARAPAQPAAASAWPRRPLRLVVPCPAGGTADAVARLLAPELQARLGHAVVVDSRPGADGNIGSAEVAGATDGHSLLMGSAATHVINPLLSQHLPYDPVRDFAPIGLVATVPGVLVVNPGLARAHGLRSVADLVRLASLQPGRLLIASGGDGHPSHLAGELFRRLTRTYMLHFPYRSAASARQDVVAGNMDLMFDSLPAALPQIRAGRLVALAIAGERRSPLLPALPTVDEAGGAALKGFDPSTWLGLFVPSSQPTEQLARLQRDTRAALAQPLLRERLGRIGLLPQGGEAGEFAALIAAEAARWALIVRVAGARVDR